MGRFRRALTAALATLALSGVFVGAMVGGVLLHLDLRPTRSVTRFVVNALLDSLFEGKVVVGEISRLSLNGVAVRDAVALDPRGEQVAAIKNLVATADVLAIVRSALGTGELRIVIPHVTVGDADVQIEGGPGDHLTITEVFVPRAPSPPEPHGRPLYLALDRVEIGHAWGHGLVAPGTLIDADAMAAVGSLILQGEALRVDVATDVEARSPTPQPARGRTTYELHSDPSTLGMAAAFEGTVGEIETHAEARLEEDYLSGNVVIGRATAEAISACIPGGPAIPIRMPVASADAQFDGNLPDLAFHAHVGFGEHGAVDTEGRLTTTPVLHLDGAVAIQNLDPRVLLDVERSTALTANAHVALEGGPSPRVSAVTTTLPFTLDGNAIPAVDAQAVLDQGIVYGTATVHENGAPTRAAFSFAKNEGLRFDVDTEAASLRAIPRLHVPVDGTARVHVAGSLMSDALDARVTGSFNAVRAPGEVEIDGGRVEGRVYGPLKTLKVDARAWGRGLRLSNSSWNTLSAHAKGPLLSPHITTVLDGPSGEVLRASGALEKGGSAIHGVAVNLRRDKSAVDGRISRVTFGKNGVHIEGLDLEGDGIGALKGGLVVRGKEITGTLRGEAVDLGKVAWIAGLREPVGGIANIDIDLASRRDGHRVGHVNLEIEEGNVAVLKGLSGNISIQLDGDRVKADGLVRVIAHASPRAIGPNRCDGAIAQVRVSHAEGTLPGGLLDPAAWEGLTGKVDVAADDWNLRCIAELAPTGLVLSEVAGKLTTRATIERLPHDRFPSVRSLFAKTRGLVLAGPLQFGAEKPEWDSRETDVELNGKIDGATGSTEAKVVIADSSNTPIVDVGATTVLDLPSLVDHPDRRREVIRRTPVSAEITIPTRNVAAFASLPSFVRENLPTFAGEMGGHAAFKGTINEPRVELHVEGHGVAEVLLGTTPPSLATASPGSDATTSKATASTDAPTAPLSSWGIPIDATVNAHYDGQAAAVTARLVHESKEVAIATADLILPWADVLAGRAPKPRGSLSAKLTEAPFGEIPFLADRDISGHINGIVELRGIGERPTLKVNLRIPDLRLGPDVFYDDSSFQATIQPAEGSDRGVATGKVELVAQDGGRLTTTASGDVKWQHGVLPLPDEERPASLHIDAQRFRVAAAAPFVTETLSRLDGFLDGEADLGWTRPGDPEQGRVAGQMTLTEGLFNLPQLGQDFHNARLTIAAGNNRNIAIKDFEAEGTRGKVRGSANLRFAGLRFEHGDAQLSIARGEEIPVTIEGVPFGDARGALSVSADNRDRELDLHVAIPNLHLTLPAAVARGVQSLDPDTEISVAPSSGTASEVRSTDGKPVVVTCDLGAIHVKARMLDVDLTGNKQAPLRIEVANKTTITGGIRLLHGRVEVLKKQFDIDQGGQITFLAKDPLNPDVHVSARWESPEGPIVVSYIGKLLPITHDKLRFSSTSPALQSQQQILAMLINGGQEATPTPGLASLGQSAAGQALFEALTTDIAPGIRTRVGLSETGTVQPGVSWVGDNTVINLSTYESAGQTGAASGVVAGDSAARGSHKVVTFDWRFFRNWLLRGRVDVGSDQTNSGVDVLWQHRY